MKYIVYKTTCKINNKIYIGVHGTVKAGYKNAKQVALGKRQHCKGFIFKYLD